MQISIENWHATVLIILLLPLIIFSYIAMATLFIGLFEVIIVEPIQKKRKENPFE